MASRRPLVQINGSLQELPPGDTIISASGGGSSITSGVVEIDFGAYPGNNEAQVIVTGQTGIGSSSFIFVDVNIISTVDHTEQDASYVKELCSFSIGNIVNNTGFTVYARSIHKMQGKFSLIYTWL